MKFNTRQKQQNEVVNHAGGKAFSMTPEFELYTLVATTNFSDKFYESSNDRLTRLRQLVAACEPEFVAKLAVYAREQLYLRSVPLVLAVELSKIASGTSLVSRLVARVIQRADEITELYSYYALSNGMQLDKIRKVSKQIEKGLRQSFYKFDEYQFAKYNRDSAVKLRDVLFKVHPKPQNEEQALLFKKIAEDTLATPVTWETELSAKGNSAEVWNALIDNKKLGYMAMLRNLRNIAEAGVDVDRLTAVTDFISSENAVKNSKQLPFRFLSAYRELVQLQGIHTSKILNALESAVRVSVENVKGFDADVSVAVACDVSGSMQVPVSPKSKVQNFDIGLMLGMLLQSRCKTVVSGIFGDTFKIVNLPQSSVLQNVLELHRREGEVGYSTNGYLVLDTLRAHNMKIDKVMMFTDCQMWDSNYGSNSMQAAWSRYKQFHPTAKLYLFDLAGHGQMPVSQKDSSVYCVAGWSDKVFDILDAFENGSDALGKIREIVV